MYSEDAGCNSEMRRIAGCRDWKTSNHSCVCDGESYYYTLYLNNSKNSVYLECIVIIVANTMVVVHCDETGDCVVTWNQ